MCIRGAGRSGVNEEGSEHENANNGLFMQGLVLLNGDGVGGRV